MTLKDKMFNSVVSSKCKKAKKVNEKRMRCSSLIYFGLEREGPPSL